MSIYKIEDVAPPLVSVTETDEIENAGGRARFSRFPGLSASIAMESVDPLTSLVIAGELQTTSDSMEGAIAAMRNLIRGYLSMQRGGSYAITVHGQVFPTCHLASFEHSGKIMTGPSDDTENPYAATQAVRWVWRRQVATIDAEGGE